MLMNENSELRSLLRLSKNFSKNIINKSIKNNIVLINNDGDVKSKRKHRGFIPSTSASILTYIKFNLSTKTAFPINIFTNIIFSIPINIFTNIIFSIPINIFTNIIFSIPISIVTFSHIKFFIYLFFLIVIRSLIYIVYLILIYIFSFTVAYIISYIRIRLSLSPSIIALVAPLLLSSFALPIIVLLKSPAILL